MAVVPGQHFPLSLAFDVPYLVVYTPDSEAHAIKYLTGEANSIMMCPSCHHRPCLSYLEIHCHLPRLARLTRADSRPLP